MKYTLRDSGAHPVGPECCLGCMAYLFQEDLRRKISEKYAYIDYVIVSNQGPIFSVAGRKLPPTRNANCPYGDNNDLFGAWRNNF